MSLIKFKKIRNNIIEFILYYSKTIRKFYNLFYYYSKYSSLLIKKADENWQKHSIHPGNQIIKTIHEKFFNTKKNGYFVELGAYTGVNKSNTYILEKFFDWSGICIEPNDYYYEILKRSRSCICVNECVDGDEKIVDFLCYKTTGGIVSADTDNDKKTADIKLTPDGSLEEYKIVKKKTKTLYKILKKNKAPPVMDFLSLDVEGAETRILENFPFNKYIFKIMMIERPSEYLDKIIIKNGYNRISIESEKKQLDDNFYIHKSMV